MATLDGATSSPSDMLSDTPSVAAGKKMSVASAKDKAEGEEVIEIASDSDEEAAAVEDKNDEAYNQDEEPAEEPDDEEFETQVEEEDDDAYAFDEDDLSPVKPSSKKRIKATESLPSAPPASSTFTLTKGPRTKASCKKKEAKQQQRDSTVVKGKPKATKKKRSLEYEDDSDLDAVVESKQEEERIIGDAKSEQTSKKKKKKVTQPTAVKDDSSKSVKRSKKKSKNEKTDATATDENTVNEATKPAAAKPASRKPSADPSSMVEDSKKKTPPVNAAAPSSSASTDDPPKKKKKKLNFQDIVFQHMFHALKPFTLKTLAAELDSTEESLKYVMLTLTDKGLVDQKEFTSSKGKSKTLYWAVDGIHCKEVVATHKASPEEQKAVQQKLQSLRAELIAIQKTVAEIRSDLSNAELEERLQTEEVTRNELQQKIDAIRARLAAPPPQASVGRFHKPPPKPSNPNQLKRRINQMRDEWKKRKQKCMDFIDQLSDAMEKSPKEAMKVLDIETDEMLGVELPAKHVLEPAVKKPRR